MTTQNDSASVAAETRDWTLALAEPLMSRLASTLNQLNLSDLQRFPPPRIGGLPFGHEWRILRRYLAGRSTVQDPSGLSSFYLKSASNKERTRYRAFILRRPLSRVDWVNLIGRDDVDDWERNALLQPTATGELRSAFRAVPFYNLTLVADPVEFLDDHRVPLGQDGFNFVEVIRANCDVRGPVLDVGCGSGVILLSTQVPGHRCVGVDINTRAIRIAQFNSLLNGISSEILERDIFRSPHEELGRFEFVTWNTPFVYFPENERAANREGAGGELGIEIPLAFFELLAEYLTETGQAALQASSPVLTDGRNVMEEELRSRGARVGLNTTVHVVQDMWYPPPLGNFHRERGIAKFEVVILQVKRSKPGGAVRRVEPPLTRRAADLLRGRLYDFRLRRARGTEKYWWEEKSGK